MPIRALPASELHFRIVIDNYICQSRVYSRLRLTKNPIGYDFVYGLAASLANLEGIHQPRSLSAFPGTGLSSSIAILPNSKLCNMFANILQFQSLASLKYTTSNTWLWS